MVKKFEPNKLHETLKEHHEIIKKIVPKIKKEIGLEKKSRKASVNREFIEIFAKMELSKTIHEANKNKSKFLSKAVHIVSEAAKSASQKKNKKKGKIVAAAVDKSIQGIIKGRKKLTSSSDIDIAQP